MSQLWKWWNAIPPPQILQSCITVLHQVHYRISFFGLYVCGPIYWWELGDYVSDLVWQTDDEQSCFVSLDLAEKRTSGAEVMSWHMTLNPNLKNWNATLFCWSFHRQSILGICGRKECFVGKIRTKYEVFANTAQAVTGSPSSLHGQRYWCQNSIFTWFPVRQDVCMCPFMDT